MGLAAPTFRFDVSSHTYFLNGEQIPHITRMLEATGWVDQTFFTEDSTERGQAVHALTASYDLGALDVATHVSRYRGWLLAHVKAMRILKPTWQAIEEPAVHPVYRFGGRPDRVGTMYAMRAVVEVKSCGQGFRVERSHQLQTALQAILVSADFGLPADAVQRFGLYLRDNGQFRLEHHRDRRDFDEARRIIKRTCQCAA